MPTASITLPPALLDKLSDGLIHLTAQGTPLSVTRAARPWLRRAIEKSAELGSMIQASKAGKLELPALVNLSTTTADEPGDSPDAWLFHMGAEQYALLIRLDAKNATPNDLGPFLTLIGNGLSKDFTRIATSMRQTAETQPPLVLERITRFESLLFQITALSKLESPQLAQFEERMLLTSTLYDIIDDLHATSGPRVDLESGRDMAPGAVYGSTYWITNALSALIRQLRDNCPPMARVRLLLQQVGDFIVVNGSVDSSTPVQPVAGTKPRAANAAAHGLQLPFCEYIVAVHGGTLKLRDMATEDPGVLPGESLESFTLTLPTGLPAQDRNPYNCPQCRLNILQLRQYAVDLANVMALQSEPSP